ncbi:MAG: succinate dehydrogenase assembly factor 2 [Xanthobacteraceae bacterium]|nr:succinate dehydrogenase assembly factor 2 [Xanthobacteraceae bacterium]
MTGTTRSSHGLDDRRKRLLYRCWHRGTREMDLILGRFADAHIDRLSDAELAEFERLIEAHDHDLYPAFADSVPPLPEFAGAMFERIKSFRVSDPDL